MIDKPVEGVKTDARAHPAGKKGAKISLKEVAERAWKARMSSRLKAWAHQQLEKCDLLRSGTRRERMQCLLDAFRAKVPYIPDQVMGEHMSTPNQLLCLDEGGLCMLAGDCDDMSISMVALALCIGIPGMVIGSSHKDPIDLPTHVFGAFQDENEEWVKMDATTKYPVGQVGAHIREWWVEPGEKAKETGEGDFVGMSGSEVGVSGMGSALPTMLDLLYPGIR